MSLTRWFDDYDRPADVAWMGQAACKGVDASLMFPARGESDKEAKALCAGCPVRAQCLGYAMNRNHIVGVWGGTSERERRQIRRGLRRGTAA